MKRFIALLATLALLMCMLPSGVFAVSDNAFTVSIVADMTAANPGNTINFSVVVQQIGKMTSFETTLVIPTGMTYVEGSLQAADKSVLAWDELSGVEDGLVVYGYGDAYTGTAPVTLATFQCTVDANVSGNLTVTPDTDPDFTYAEDDQFELKAMTIVPAVIDVQIPVTGVTLNKNSLSLKTGESETLVATIDPNSATNKNVSWKSDDSTVATVDDNGKVVAVKEGTTTITVTTEDGGFKATCAVSVACSHANKTETPASDADCVNSGNNKYYTCNACGDVFKADGVTETTVQAETLPALQHDFTEKIEDAAHQVAGSGANCQQAKVYYFDCSRCAVMGTTTWTSDAKGNHKMETTWTTENNKHYHKCSVTGCTYIEDEANCSGGTATCTAKAVCSTCNKTYGEMLDHDLTHYAKNAADHTKPGNIEYWQCEDCDKYFSDASANTEITKAQTVIEQIPHSHSTTWSKNATQHWNECSCGDKINVYDHNYDNTCDTTCNTCGYVRTITHTWMTTLSHNATQHWTECSVCHEKKEVEGHHGGTANCQNKAVCDDCQQPYGSLTGCDFTAEKAEDKYLVSAATCKDAAVYYKSCTVCGKSGTATFTTAKNPNNHVGGTEIRGAFGETCTVNGYTGDTHCKGCDAKLASGQPIVATGHSTATPVAAVASTCKTQGHKAYYHCSVCDKDFLEKAATAAPQSTADLKLPLNANNHEGGTEIRGASAETCTVGGYTGDTHCKGCDAQLEKGQVIPATAHKTATAVPEEESTCKTNGVKAHFHCPVCNKDYLEKTTTAVAQNADDLKLPLNPEKHEGDTEVKDAAPATCTVDGYTGDTYCKGCTVKIATGTAIPAAHKLDKVVAAPATHEAAGNIEHYACSVCEKLYNDDKATTELTEAEVVVPKGEHSYSEAFKSDENGHWKECDCGSKIEEGTHTFGEWTVVKESTTTVKGSKEKACSVCGYKVTEDLPLAENKDPNNPQTGDNSQLGLWITLMLISVCGLAVVLFLGTQKKGKYTR